VGISALIGEALAENFQAFSRIFEKIGGAVEEEVGGFDGSGGAVLVLKSADHFGHGAGIFPSSEADEGFFANVFVFVAHATSR